MVVTRATRNRFVGVEPARGFESHRLRQKPATAKVVGFIFKVGSNPRGFCRQENSVVHCFQAKELERQRKPDSMQGKAAADGESHRLRQEPMTILSCRFYFYPKGIRIRKKNKTTPMEWFNFSSIILLR